MFSCLVKNDSIKYFDSNNSKVCTSILLVKAVFQNTIVILCLRPLSDYLTAIKTRIRPLALISSAIGFLNGCDFYFDLF